jgi:chromosome segregation ATPase
VQDGDEDDTPVWQQLLGLCEKRVLALDAQVEETQGRLQALQQRLEVERQQLEVEQQQLEMGRQRREEAHTRIAGLLQQQQQLLASPACSSKGGS